MREQRATLEKTIIYIFYILLQLLFPNLVIYHIKFHTPLPLRKPPAIMTNTTFTSSSLTSFNIVGNAHPSLTGRAGSSNTTDLAAIRSDHNLKRFQTWADTIYELDSQIEDLLMRLEFLKAKNVAPFSPFLERFISTLPSSFELSDAQLIILRMEVVDPIISDQNDLLSDLRVKLHKANTGSKGGKFMTKFVAKIRGPLKLKHE